MPRQALKQQTLNVFSKGLNTEASPLVFPEGTVKSVDNIDILRNGSAKRRRSFDLEIGGGHSTTTFTRATLKDFAISKHEWKSVDSQDDLNFLVIQIGGVLYFHKLGEDIVSLNVVGSIDLSPIQVSADFTKEPISATSGKGKLFIVGRFISPAYIQYDADNNDFTGRKLTIKIRDVEGIPESIGSPDLLFGEVTPPPGTPPEDDTDDILVPFAPDIDIPFDEINIPAPY